MGSFAPALNCNFATCNSRVWGGLQLQLKGASVATQGASVATHAWGSCVCCFFLFVLGACCPCLRLFLAAGGSETKFFELCGAPVGRQKKGPEEPPKSERQGQTGTRRKGEGRMKKPRRYTPGTPPTPRKSFFSRSAPLRTGRCSVCLLAASKQASKQSTAPGLSRLRPLPSSHHISYYRRSCWADERCRRA